MADTPKTKKQKTKNTAANKTSGFDTAKELCELLKEHNGGDVTLIDLRNIPMWTDFFIIVTVTSSTHLGGLERRIKEKVKEKNLGLLRSHKKSAKDDDWQFCDLGDIVIHLMSEKSRAFYDLERLWTDGVITKF
ncbi:MAG: ribosome silencing factor [Termitinemataceae bacterium]|nr:MAG: ribosome silencing factor [Termitinemataceae bacterium]